MELSLPYVFTAPTGARFVVGNSDLAKSDPDWVGSLDPDNGITGLLDGADVIPGPANPITQGDGLNLGVSRLGGRSGAIQGMLDPNVSVTTREAYEAKMKKAIYESQTADATFKWTPSGGGPERMIRLRSVGRPDFRGRHPKTFMAMFVSPDPVVVSSAVQSIELPGANFTFSGQPFVFASQLGNAPAVPWFRADGPFNLPTRFWSHQGDAGLGGYQAVTTAAGTALTENEFLLIHPARRLLLRYVKNVYTFEAVGLSGWGGNMGVGETLTRVNTVTPHGGSWQLKVDVAAPAAGRGAFVGMIVRRGRTYQISAWVRGSGAGEQLALQVGYPQLSNLVSTTFIATAAYQRVQVTFTAAYTGSVAVVVYSTDAVAKTYYIDDVMTDGEPTDISGLLLPAGSVDPSSGGLVGPWPLMPGGANVQWDILGSTSRTPLAQAFWRHSWR